jgi:hypothetical protein
MKATPQMSIFQQPVEFHPERTGLQEQIAVDGKASAD